MNKKEWLDYLYYKLGNQRYDFKVSGLVIQGDKIIATKRIKYSEACFGINPWELGKIEWINQRETFPNEIVLDLENKEQIQEVLKKLDRLTSDYKVYDTGSRGFHIHIFFREELTREDKENFIKLFGADLQLAYPHNIALEHCSHWKSGKVKKEVKWNKNLQILEL